MIAPPTAASCLFAAVSSGQVCAARRGGLDYVAAISSGELRGAARCRGPGGPSAVPSTTAILATQEGCGRATEVIVHATN